MSDCQNPKEFPFLNLPAEIQGDILRSFLLISDPIPLLASEVPKKTDAGEFRMTKGKLLLLRLPLFSQVLRVCRQIHQEGMRILYGENTFLYYWDACDREMLRTYLLAPASQRMIRKLEFRSLKYLAHFQGSFSRFHSLQQINVDVTIRMGKGTSPSDFSEADFRNAMDKKLGGYPQHEAALTELLVMERELNVVFTVKPYWIFSDVFKPAVSWRQRVVIV